MSGASAKVGAIESRCYLNVLLPFQKYPCPPQLDHSFHRYGKYLCAKAEKWGKSQFFPMGKTKFFIFEMDWTYARGSVL